MNQELFEGIAADLGRQISPKFSAVEVVACSAETAKNMAGGDGNFIARSIWKEAVAVFVSKLPANEIEAQRTIKTTAAKILNDPFILENFEKQQVARLKIEEAEAEIQAAEGERSQRLQRVQLIRQNIKKLAEERNRWDVDWLAVGNQAEVIIAQNFGKEFTSNYDQSVLDGAWNDYQKAPLLAKLAPERMKLLGDKIENLEAALRELTPKPALAEPPPLADAEPEEGLKPIVTARDRKVIAA